MTCMGEVLGSILSLLKVSPMNVYPKMRLGLLTWKIKWGLLIKELNIYGFRSRFIFCECDKGFSTGVRGNWPRKGVWGCASLKTSFSRFSCSSQGSHFNRGVARLFKMRGQQGGLRGEGGWLGLKMAALHRPLYNRVISFGARGGQSPPGYATAF